MPQHAHRRSRAIRKAAGCDRAWDAFEPLELRRLLATFTVTNLLDAGEGSLRAAIAAANAEPGADTIEFDQGVTGRITLTSGQLTITDDLEINGPGARLLELSAGNDSRVFTVGTTTAAISGLTITDGRNLEGGGIYNSGTLTLTGVAVVGNSAPADFEEGGRGGGIFNLGTLTVIRSTIAYNDARTGHNFVVGEGGGIFSTGTLTVINSTISRNFGSGGGGNLIVGGGIRSTGTLTIHNSTITDNASEDVEIDDGSADIISTIIGWLDIDTSTVTLTNSLVEELDGTLEPASANNLIGVDARLAPLAYNGGHTLTHLLLADSPALGAGSNLLDLTTDQRGGLFERSRTAGVDIGAFQSQEAPGDLIVSTLSDQNDGDYSQGQLSLREALELAIYVEGADTITFDPQINSGTITLIGFELAVLSDVNVTGPGASLLTLSGAGASRVFFIGEGVVATIDGLTITQGLGTFTPFTSNEEGGGIYNKGELTLSNAVVSDNAAYLGAGIRSTGRLTLSNSTIAENTSTGSGGGLATNGPATINDSIITANTAEFGGGGIIAYGVLTLNNSTVSNNIGGGILASAPLTLRGSTVSGNTSESAGAGISSNDTTRLIDSTVSGNAADGIGGGIASTGTLTLTRSTVSGNTAGLEGGGVRAYGAVTLTDSTISDNESDAEGGGIYTAHELTITRSTISGNQADGNGGGIYATGETTITNSTISGNTSDDRGGGLYTGSALVVINNSTVADNSAEILGGGIHSGGTLRLRSTIVAGNAGFDVAGTVVAGSVNNLVQDATVAVGLVNGQNGNIIGVDPLLAPLADNGGPTLTHALSSASPAIGAGANPLSLSTDQRGTGFARAIDGRIDIGAFQQQTSGATTLALFGGGQLNQAIAHETKARRSNGTGFGPVERDDDSKQITYRIANTGPNALVISSIEIRGQRPDDFFIISMPDLILAPGATTEFTVSFDPTAYGSRRANVAIFTNDPANAGRFTMRIAGIGTPDPELPDIAVTAGTADIRDNDRKARPDTGQRFGGAEVGQTVVMTYTITNRGFSTLTVGQITIDSGRFVVSQQPGNTSLAAGQSTTFTVTFTPDTAASHRAMLSIASNDPDEDPFNFRIAGFGMA